MQGNTSEGFSGAAFFKKYGFNEYEGGETQENDEVPVEIDRSYLILEHCEYMKMSNFIVKNNGITERTARYWFI